MEKSFEMAYELVQQSPLIHFQYDQTGATLRATEVKPKLDRYLIKHIGRENLRGCFLSDADALNYKMRFSSTKNVEYIELGKGDYDIYYGNMGSNTKKVKAVNFKSYVTLTIICFDERLRKLIDKHISDFFIVTNFGRMQNKGFGSFLIKQNRLLSPEYICEKLCEEYEAKKGYKIVDNGDPVFRVIKTVYSIMKSGVNFRGFRRSLLFTYMHSLETEKGSGVGNEKAHLKQIGLAPSVGTHKQHDTNQKDAEHYYVRALIGVGDHLDFLNKPNEDRKDKTAVSISNDEIERLASAVFFKIIDNTVYFVGKRIDSRVFDKEFIFKVKKTTDSYKPVKYEEKIKTPPENEIFNKDFMDGFLEYCFKELNNPSPAFNQTPLSGFLNDKKIKIEEV